jgi:phage terminase small subunit
MKEESKSQEPKTGNQKPPPKSSRTGNKRDTSKMSPIERAREACTIQQQRFCEEYIIDGNGSRSAKEAGYSERSAAAIANNLLKTNPKIQEYINQLRIAQQRRTDSDADKVVEELSKLGYANIADYYDKKGALIEVKKLPSYASAAIHSIKETEFKMTEGASKIVREYKLHDKLGALRELLQHHANEQGDGSGKDIKINIVINRKKNAGHKNIEDEPS